MKTKEQEMQEYFNNYLQTKFEVVEHENELIQEKKLDVTKTSEKPYFCSEKDFIQEILDDFLKDIKLHFGHNNVRKVKFFYEEGSPVYYSNIFSAIVEVYSDIKYNPTKF